MIWRVRSHKGEANDRVLHQPDGLSGLEPLGALYSCSMTIYLVLWNNCTSNCGSWPSASLFRSWTSTQQFHPITLNCISLSQVIVILINENWIEAISLMFFTRLFPDVEVNGLGLAANWEFHPRPFFLRALTAIYWLGRGLSLLGTGFVLWPRNMELNPSLSPKLFELNRNTVTFNSEAG